MPIIVFHTLSHRTQPCSAAVTSQCPHQEALDLFSLLFCVKIPVPGKGQYLEHDQHA